MLYAQTNETVEVWATDFELLLKKNSSPPIIQRPLKTYRLEASEGEICLTFMTRQFVTGFLIRSSPVDGKADCALCSVERTSRECTRRERAELSAVKDESRER